MWLDCFEVFTYRRGSDTQIPIDSVNQAIRISGIISIHLKHTQHSVSTQHILSHQTLDDTDEFHADEDGYPRLRMEFEYGEMIDLNLWPDHHTGPWELPEGIWDMRYKSGIDWNKVFEQIMKDSCPLLNVFDVARFLEND